MSVLGRSVVWGGGGMRVGTSVAWKGHGIAKKISNVYTSKLCVEMKFLSFGPKMTSEKWSLIVL